MKRLLSLALALVMALSLMPATALAAICWLLALATLPLAAAGLMSNFGG